MTMMTVHITCPGCGSGVDIYPSEDAKLAHCDICQHDTPVNFSDEDLTGVLKSCCVCKRKDFYQQKDFNRKLGVLLFIIAAILAVYTYGISLIVLYLVDLFLFGKLQNIAICYKCQTVYRRVRNIKEIPPFDHERNDRIVYSDHDFEGRPL